MEIKFYTYEGKPNVINKSLPDEVVINGKMVNDYSIDNPTIKLQTFVPNYNYAYVPSLNRYYWVEDFDIEPNKFYIVYLKLDPLMTFKEEIMKAHVHLSSCFLKDSNKKLSGFKGISEGMSPTFTGNYKLTDKYTRLMTVIAKRGENDNTGKE